MFRSNRFASDFFEKNCCYSVFYFIFNLLQDFISAKILRCLVCLTHESLLKLTQAAQVVQSSSIITKANKYLKNLILSCLVIFVYLFIYMFLARSAFNSISYSILTAI